MGAVKGKLVSCDRCGKNIFLKYVGKEYGGNMSDPEGYERYEDRPKTWVHDTHFGDLCDDCSLDFNLILNEFFGPEKYNKIAPAWKVETDVS